MKPPKPAPSRTPEMGALDLIEEATHALRAAPVATLVCYFAGTLPFVLALIYFWADMSLSPFARNHDAAAALGLALLYLWMKFWHNVFARRLLEQVSGGAPSAWGFGRVCRVAMSQAALQAASLLLAVPPLMLVWLNKDNFLKLLLSFPALAFVLVVLGLFITTLIFSVPFAFFHFLGALDEGAAQPLGELVKRAGRLAGLWKRQNLIVLMLLSLFALFVFLNWMSLFLLLPGLVHSLLGIESAFTRAGPFAMINSSFLAANVGLTYLCVDPLLRALYVLRGFYGEARHSGEDLKARLKGVVLRAKGALALACLALVLFTPSLRAADTARAPAPAAPSPAAPSVSPEQLDQTINDVIHQDKYAWRVPGDEKLADDEADQSVIGRFITHIREMLRQWMQDGFEWLRKFIFKMLPGSFPGVGDGAGGAGISATWVLIFALGAFILSALALFLYRYLRERRRRSQLIHAQPLAAIPNLEDENVGAEALPEDGWTKLARELLARGEYRLALRAFYLSSLANLAARNLISLAKFKSNRDYERELRRRGHAFPQLPPTFAQTVATFERVWYGLHAVNPELVTGFSEQVDKLRRAE